LRGEESAAFGKAYLGSNALFGFLTRADLELTDPANGRHLGESMREVGIDTDRATNGVPVLPPQKLAAWLELHIEQGPNLPAKTAPIGIVTGLRGNVRHHNIECIGSSDH